MNKEERKIEQIIEILACPKCKSELKLKEKELICKKCGKKYQIIDKIPIFI